MILTGSIVAARHLMLYRRRTRIKFVLPGPLPRRRVAAEQREDGSRTQAGQSLPSGLISAGVKTICRAMDGPLEEVCIYDRMDTDKHGFSISDRRPLPSSFSISGFQFSSARKMPRLFYFTGQLS